MPPGAAGTGRVVSCDLAFDVRETADIALQIAIARGSHIRDERLDLAVDGRPIARPAELAAPHGGRIHLLRAPQGILTVSYRADLLSSPGTVGPLYRDPARTDPAVPAGSAPADGIEGTEGTEGTGRGDGQLDLEQLTYLRPSRYCPSDHVVGLAVAEFGGLPPGRSRVEAVADWIFTRVGYVAGSSTVHDSAEDTLLTGQGVCRDFAHLGVTLCRALQVPARFAAVYPPGLTPMDFHAVFEAWIDGAWRVYDATRRVPRGSLVRIATGRDATDTAFASVLSGIAGLQEIEVTATVTGRLPDDDHTGDARLG